MKILAIGAHPDDIEIFMYGLLSVCKKRGDKIGLIVATDGAAGNIKSNINLSTIRETETKKALEGLGVVNMLGLPDGKLLESQNAIQIIDNAVNFETPDLIVTHAPEDYHSDHRALSIYVQDVAGFKCPIIFADTLMGIKFFPDFYIDITNCFEAKMDAIMCHQSQGPEKFASAMKLMNRYRAAQCNAPNSNYAEAYRVNKRFPFTDIRHLLPKPPPLRPFYNDNPDAFI
jgi:N-acetylglucosamine malate deacetylase 1